MNKNKGQKREYKLTLFLSIILFFLMLLTSCSNDNNSTSATANTVNTENSEEPQNDEPNAEDPVADEKFEAQDKSSDIVPTSKTLATENPFEYDKNVVTIEKSDDKINITPKVANGETNLTVKYRDKTTKVFVLTIKDGVVEVKIKTWTVTFDVDGANETAPEAQIIEDGEKIDKTKLSGTFTKTGCADFNASSGTWLAGDDIFDFETPIKTDITLKAKWYQKESDFKEVKGTKMSLVEGSAVFVEGRPFQIEDFWICDHEVTQGEWENVMGSNPSYFQGDDADKKVAEGENQENRPVETVNWYDAIVYCNKRSMKEGLTPCYKKNDKINADDWGPVPDVISTDLFWADVVCNWNVNGYRLPTEVEWEYAARGGDLVGTQTTYSGSNDIGEVAWYSSNSENKTHEVRKKDSNKLGLYDMSGNVCEWCWDWSQTRITSVSPERGPETQNYGYYRYRIYRGCGFFSIENDWASKERYTIQSPKSKNEGLGFRVVRSSL